MEVFIKHFYFLIHFLHIWLCLKDNFSIFPSWLSKIQKYLNMYVSYTGRIGVPENSAKEFQSIHKEEPKVRHS